MVESRLTRYEECRRRRLEENKKRMEELNLTNLSLSLKPTNTHHPKRLHFPKQQLDHPIRRSIRVANKPPPDYTYGNPNRQRNPNGVHTMERAHQLQAGLDSEYPSFVKSIAPAHVTGSFLMSIPTNFCKNHLSPCNKTITLVDEEGDEFSTRYLVKRNFLRGWKEFAVDHELVDGDALVFHFVKPRTFKVHIIRAYESEADEENEEDGDNVGKNEDSDVARLTRSAKRIRASRK